MQEKSLALYSKIKNFLKLINNIEDCNDRF